MKVLLLAMAAGCAWGQTPDVVEIMSRVAANQEKSMEQRKDWVYHQKQVLRMRRGNGRMAREEHREYTVAPEVNGVKKDLTRFDGRYENKGKLIAYDAPGYKYRGMDIDGDLIDEMSNDMINDNSRDGIGKNLFPLTSAEQSKYNFKLIANEKHRGRPVYRIAFEPNPKGEFDDNSFWKGEALIDAEECQPVSISTKMAPKIPMAVKVLLGTNIKGLGFAVSYQKFADGVWFPVSYGGEFEIRAVFFYKRNISISMVNGDFRRTNVSSNVAYMPEDK